MSLTSCEKGHIKAHSNSLESYNDRCMKRKNTFSNDVTSHDTTKNIDKDGVNLEIKFYYRLCTLCTVGLGYLQSLT